MAKKPAVRYVCNNCGAISAAWAGRCPQCGEWNTLIETVETTLSGGFGRQSSTGSVLDAKPITSSKIPAEKRLSTGTRDIDNLLGGGIVQGSVTLVAGQPGIGKSTLLLQIASEVSKYQPALYVSAEESEHQVGLRAKRLGQNNSGLRLASSTSTDDIAATIRTGQFKFVIVDSIQTVGLAALSSAAGTVSQITNSTQYITAAAKDTNTAVFLVGHVTKEGMIAGPKLLEHVVDTVLQIEGDRYGGFKVLRAIKNRFGSTSEAAIMEMKDYGMAIVDNPSAALLEERQVSDGSIVLATMEGSRPILVEVQALVNKSNYGYPKRAASGFELNRLNLLIAMLEKRTKLNLADQDIYLNIVGGIEVKETAADLAICMAIASASRGMQLKENSVVFGEIGLSGEIRRVVFMDKRIEEANRLGFSGSIGPQIKDNRRALKNYMGVPDIKTALNKFLSR